MKHLFTTIFLIFLFGCTSTDVKKLEEKQTMLEHKIDSLENVIKTHEEILLFLDSVYINSNQPKPGSLLYELENQSKN